MESAWGLGELAKAICERRVSPRLYPPFALPMKGAGRGKLKVKAREQGQTTTRLDIRKDFLAIQAVLAKETP